MEDKLVIVSAKGFTTAASSMKHLKATDTFFNRWPLPLVPIGTLRTCKVTEYDQMFLNDLAGDRLEEDCVVLFESFFDMLQ